MAIKNIVFDMANVLMLYDKNYYLDRCGITDSEERTIILRDVLKSVEWIKMDRGLLTRPEAMEIFRKRVPEHVEKYLDYIVRGWEMDIVPVPGMKELVAELKENGYGIYLLSNAGYDHYDYWLRIPGSELFDEVLFSCDVHQLKPEHEIYETFLSRFGLKAEECVFIDDMNYNIESACLLGFNGIVFFNDMARLRHELAGFGVRCRTE